MADEAPHELFLIDGNSLVYRAFFALPETIATSRGFPTNAIFGFASMLVKLMTEYGQKPTIVAWDAGMSGREEVYSEYKAGRAVAARPAQGAVARTWSRWWTPSATRNVQVRGLRGRRRDRHPGPQRAREQGIEVMIVTGDRDTFQLDRATACGSWPPAAASPTRRSTTARRWSTATASRRSSIPDFYGLKGDTSDNIPGVPGIGDKTAAQLLQQLRRPRDGARQRRRDLRRQAQGEPDQPRRRRAHLQAARHLHPRRRPSTVDLDDSIAREPDRSRLREVFREFELRDPLRRLEEALGDEDAAPRRGPRRGRSQARLRAGARRPACADLERRARRPGGRAAEPRRGPAARPGRRPEPLRFAAYAGGDEVLAGEAETLAALLAGLGRPAGGRPTTGRRSRRPRTPRGPPLAHDTMVAAYLIDPARRGYPLEELAEERASGAEVDATATTAALAEHAVFTRGLAERQRERLEEHGLTRLLRGGRAAAGGRAGRHGARRRAARRGAGARRSRRGSARRRRRSSARSGSSPGRSSRSARPSSSARSCSRSSGCRRSGAARPASPPTPGCSRPSAHEHEIIPKIEEWRELTKLKSHLPRRLPRAGGRRRAAAHHLQPDHRRHRPPVEHRPQPAEHPDPHRARARDPRLLRGRGGQPADLRRLLAGRVAAAGPHRRGGRAQGDLPARARTCTRPPRSRSSVGVGRDADLDVDPDALEGQDGQLRHRLRALAPTAWPTGCRSPRRRRRSSSTATSSASRRSRRSSTRRSRGQGRGLRGHGLRPHPPDPRAARAPAPDPSAGRAPRGEHGDSGHGRRHHQGRDGALPRGAARRGPHHARWSCRSTTSCSSRGPRPRSTRPLRSFEREMAGAFEMDPPLEVDVASGVNWLEAK